MRAPVGPAEGHMNVLQVTRISAGLASWLAAHASQELSQERQDDQSHPLPDSVFSSDVTPSVVIGYDARYGSHIFATTTAEVCAGAGFEVTLLPVPSPTPLVPWMVRNRGFDAGIQITASHNPAPDNGYKIYAGDGAQISRVHEPSIEAAIAAVGDPLNVPRVTVRPTTDQVRRYIDAVVKLVEPRQGDLLRVNNERAALRVAYTALHGVGGRTMNQALQAAGFALTWPVLAQHYPDPTFPTVSFPNPEEAHATKLVLELAAEQDADIIIALDPDADRCAIGYRTSDGLHRMLSGDELGALLAVRLVPAGGPTGDADPRPIVATSAVSSQLLRAIAADHNWDYRETPTGFKNLSRAAGPDEKLAFAYEEANGTCPAPDLVQDKDGIATALITCAWAAELKARGMTLADELDRLYKRYGYFVGTQIAVRTTDPNALIDALSDTPAPATLAGCTVTPSTVVDGQGLRLTGHDATTGVTLRVSIRASGTENKVKIYSEAMHLTDRDKAQSVLDAATSDIRRFVDRV